MRFKMLFLLIILGIFSASCISAQKQVQVEIVPENPYQCQGYKAPESSQYVLPYKQGEDYLLVQGNCTRYSHNGLERYAFDFGLPIGTEVVAARSGEVVGIEMVNWDNTRYYEKRRYRKTNKPRGNCVKILHEDGTVGYYYHLKQNSAQVAIGDTVEQGQVIALSGNSGFTTGPHLHFAVWRAEDDRQSVPVTFSNVDYGDDFQLTDRTRYTAL